MQDPLDWLLPNTPASIPTVEEVAAWLPGPGRRPRRVLLLTDIHANWHALAVVLRQSQGHYDAIWFLGDIVGYGPRPVECVRFVRQYVSRTRRWRAGNHDLGILGRLENRPGGYKSSGAARWTWQRHRQVLKESAPDLWKWLCNTVTVARAGPTRRQYGGFEQVFVHANLLDYVGHYPLSDDRFNLLDNLRRLERIVGSYNPGAWLVVGHTHMMCLARLRGDSSEVELLPILYGQPIPIRDAWYFINPGSVGQPRDGDRRAAYAILDTAAGTVTYHRAEYDVIAAQREMQHDGYPDDLVERLWAARIRDTQFFDKVYERRPDGLLPRKTGG